MSFFPIKKQFLIPVGNKIYMDEKLFALHKTSTWELVPLPLGKSVIGCIRSKTNSNGSIERFKVRLVAKEYSQQYVRYGL